MMDNTTQCAVFDFDGTLRQGHITQTFMDELYKNHLFNEQEYAFQKEIFNQSCTSQLSYNEWLDKWAISWGKAFKGFHQKDILSIAGEVYKKHKNDLYYSSKELIKFFNDKNYKTLIISGGACEVIELFSKYLGVNHSISTKLEIVNGKYTGKMLSKIHTSEGKAIALNAFLSKNGINQPVFVFGDSAGDLAILNQAANPITLNADKELKLIALKKDWPIKTYKNIMSYLNSL